MCIRDRVNAVGDNIDQLTITGTNIKKLIGVDMLLFDSAVKIGNKHNSKFEQGKGIDVYKRQYVEP